LETLKYETDSFIVMHFGDNRNEPDMMDENYEWLWKSDDLSDSYSKYYSPTEYAAVGEIIMLFKGRVIFKWCISKKRKRFGIKIYKLCDSKEYTYSMNVY